MKNFSVFLIFFLIFAVILEDAEAGTSSRRRRRKVRECTTQSEQMKAPAINCDDLDRMGYVNRHLNGDRFDLCYEEIRSSSTEQEVSTTAKNQSNLKATIDQCFGGMAFTKVNSIERSYMDLVIKQQEEDRKQMQKSMLQILGIIIGGLALFFIYSRIN